MIIAKEAIRAACDLIAPKYDFDPAFIYAVCLKEGGKDSAGNFDPSIARMEQGYYRRYTEPMDYATTTEILLAASYGVMQMMGLSLKESGYFQFYFKQVADDFRKIIQEPFSAFAVQAGLNAYCVHIDWMVEFGCKWMDNKRTLADGNVIKMLGLWNGDRSGKYASDVLKIYNGLK